MKPQTRYDALVVISIIAIVYAFANLFYGIGVQETELVVNNYKPNTEIFDNFHLSLDLVETLDKFYNESYPNEFRVCLKGYTEKDKIIINNYSKFKLGDEDSVDSNKCNQEGELGMLHSHPSNIPDPSHADLHIAFDSYRKYNNSLSVIMSNYSKFQIYTERYWDQGFEVNLGKE